MTGTPKSIEIEGENIDEAIGAALASLGISRERAEVVILQDAKRGLLGFGGQKARVRVAERGAAVSSPTFSVEGTAELAPASAATDADKAGGAEAILHRLLALMDVPAEVTRSAGSQPGEVAFAIRSEAGALLIGRHGQTLDALEYLLNRMAYREQRDGRISVDAEGYRERRFGELREMAARMAARARQTSRPQTLPPLNARERRIVHLALSEDRGVQTRSIGEGSLRRVVITPSR